MFFTHWPQLTAPLYLILFETSICQFNSSECSPIMPDEVNEHLTRDQRHSFIQNHSRPFIFTSSPLQFTSLIFYRVQVREHLTRDQRHSFIQNHSRSSDSHLLLFSSLTHLLQGSGQRTPDKRSETFLHPESLQIFRFTASSLQFTSLIFYRVQVRGLVWPAKSWFCAQ